MSTISAGRTAYRGRERAAETGSWYSALGVDGRRAFKAAFAGYTLDAFDLIVLTLSLTAIGATFDVGTGATGALSTVTLSASALGGILGGILSDRIGRARTLMLTVAVYSLFTFLSGLATSYEMLMVFRVFQGIGFGGEWAVGAVLVAEMVRPESRGKALGVVQSAWAVGWAIAVLVYLLVFDSSPRRPPGAC
jgi:MFS family permease